MFWMHFFGFMSILAVQGTQMWKQSRQRRWDLQDRENKHAVIEKQLGDATGKLERIANGGDKDH